MRAAVLTQRRRGQRSSPAAAAEVAADAEQRGQQGAGAGQGDQQHAQVDLAALAGVPAVAAAGRLAVIVRVALPAVAALRTARVLAWAQGAGWGEDQTVQVGHYHTTRQLPSHMTVGETAIGLLIQFPTQR